MSYESYLGSFSGGDIQLGATQYQPQSNAGFAGFAGFGKWGHPGGGVTPPPTPGTSDKDKWKHEKDMMEMKHKHELEMMRLRAEMNKIQRGGKVAVPAAVKAAAAKSGAQTSTTDIKKLKDEIDKLKRKEQVAAQGGAVKGTQQSMKQLMVGKGRSDHSQFTRSQVQKGKQRGYNWDQLKKRIPADFDEEVYLTKNPDIRAAVKRGQFPSGAYHYAVYGSSNCLKAEFGRKCDNRNFKGWQRPGNLAGIFANWNWS